MSQPEAQEEFLNFSDQASSEGEVLSAESIVVSSLQMSQSLDTQVGSMAEIEEAKRDITLSVSQTQIDPEEMKESDETNYRLKFEKEQALRREAIRNLKEARSCTRKMRLQLREEKLKIDEIKNDIRTVRDVFQKYIAI